MERIDVKLFDVVMVQHAEYSHFGEVLSRVTPTDTVMVRMVPGHPGTLKEMPISALRKVHSTDTFKRPMYIHYAAVMGRHAFPIDMLRYDLCAPLNFDPETKIIDPSFGPVHDQMVVARLAPRFWGWTTSRWSSFGWSLIRLDTELFYKDRT